MFQHRRPCPVDVEMERQFSMVAGVLSESHVNTSRKIQEEESLKPMENTTVEFQKELQMDLGQRRKNVLASIKAHSLVLVLLASLTFAAFLQPPVASLENEDRDTIKYRLRLFICFNAFSFYIAIIGLLLCLFSVLPRGPVVEEAQSLVLIGYLPKYTLAVEIAATEKLYQWLRYDDMILVTVNLLSISSTLSCAYTFYLAGSILVSQYTDVRVHLKMFLAFMYVSVYSLTFSILCYSFFVIKIFKGNWKSGICFLLMYMVLFGIVTFTTLIVDFTKHFP